MSPAERILARLKRKPDANSAELCELLGVTRQALSRHLKKLLREGRIAKTGSTKSARYRLASRRTQPATDTVEKICRLRGLEEDAVYRELSLRLNLERRLNEATRKIASYAFSEMLNNAIEHSRSERCLVQASVDAYDFAFHIRDFGIGIFQSIQRKFEFPDEHAAVAELLKGKTTTMEKRHSGEGIFFTSKAADRISFRSHRTTLVFDNLKRDVVVEEGRFQSGTDVQFAVSRRSKRNLDEIFRHYAPEQFDYRFDRTRVAARVLLKNCVSRSEARRLVNGLDKFREVALDFSGVEAMGQGFADEVFRVFLLTHPHVTLRLENVRPTLAAMVRHVVDKSTMNRLTIV
jgi:DNA-binding MarR family transcriptional regulator